MVRVIVPDTSVIIEGYLSKEIKKSDKLIIHEAVLAELESQANKRREIGYQGLAEIKLLQTKCSIVFEGSRPKEFEIKFAKSGEIDSLIRDLAYKHDAVLYTGDIVQSLVAEAKGIKTRLFLKDKDLNKTVLEKFFSPQVMSVHIVEGKTVQLKKGKPGDWKLVNSKLKISSVYEVANQLIAAARYRKDSYIDSESKGSSVIQLGDYRIVICRPPFSSTYEITAVKPLTKLKLSDYNLNTDLLRRIDSKSSGMLIAGSPGSGKSTFASALAEYFSKKGLIVKSLESPRDLKVSGISQYSLNHATNKEITDMFLLSRPDISVYDEVRNDEDFALFTDLRLSGVGMIGVVHATKSIDALQRFIQRIDMGVIPNVLDTLIFVDEGKISEVFTINMEVKVPYGMTEADLARPIVGIHEFSTGLLKYEVYSYGDQKVIMSVGEEYSSSIVNLAKKEVDRELSKVFDKFKSYVLKNRVLVNASEVKHLFENNARILKSLEQKIGMKLDVKQVVFKEESFGNKNISYKYVIEGNNLYLNVSSELSGNEVNILLEGDFILKARVGKKGKIKLNRDSAHCKLIEKALKNNEKIELKK